MNELLNINRSKRDMDSRFWQHREHRIQKIMVSYGYDHANAEKVLAMEELRNFELIWGTLCGAFALQKSNAIRREMAKGHALFRKSWMKYPVPLMAFVVGYHVGTQLPFRFGRYFNDNHQVTSETYRSEHDVVGRFRFYDEHPNSNVSSEAGVASYLQTYSTEAMTKPEVIAALHNQKAQPAKSGFHDMSKMQIKRVGKDANDMYWVYGKIHGLENVAFLSKEELDRCSNNPVALQLALDNVEKPIDQPITFEQNAQNFL